jgi:hypothetical protein
MVVYTLLDTLTESTVANGCYAVGDSDGGQPAATIESMTANVCHAVGDGYRGHSVTAIKSIIAYGCHATLYD